MELKVSACKLRLIGENIFNDKYAVIGYKVCLPRRNSLKSLQLFSKEPTSSVISDWGGWGGLGCQEITKEGTYKWKKILCYLLISDVLFTLITAQKCIRQLKKINENVTSILISMELLPGNQKLLGKQLEKVLLYLEKERKGGLQEGIIKS